MRKLLLVGSLAILPAFCLPVCTTHTALEYMTGASPCDVTIGGSTFRLFGVSWVSDGGTDLLAPAADVNLTPLEDAHGSFLGLGYSRVNGQDFEAGVGQVLKTLLTWTIDPPPPIMDGFGVSLDPTGFASIVADVSYGEKKGDQTIPSPLNTDSLTVECPGGTCGTLTAQIKFVVPSNYVHADLHITLGNGEVPSSSAGGSAQVNLVPEPGAFGFAASGLLALSALALRRRRS